MKKNVRSAGIIIGIAIILIAVTIANTILVFRTTSEQTKDVGMYQLTSISGSLHNLIDDARTYTSELALRAQAVLSDREKLTDLIYAEKRLVDDGSREGCFNLYIASKDWDIIPEEFDRTGFVATERDWYRGAVRNKGETFVTPPYVDIVTGDICYTISIVLADGETVLGVDYTADVIQSYILNMLGEGIKDVVLVTGEGVIAGCRDESLIGSRLADEFPDYSGIFSLVKSKGGFVSTRIQSFFLFKNIFASDAGTGWYLIVSIEDRELYGSAYRQLLISLIISLALMSTIISLYIYSLKQRTKAEKVLESRDAFLHRITKDLKEPLRQIREYSGEERVKQSDDHETNFEKINSATKNLSEMIEQISSYTTLQKSAEDKPDQGATAFMAKKSRKLRTIILILTIVGMLISSMLSFSSAYNLRIARMQIVADSFESPLLRWIDKQRTILDMFVNIVSSDPGMLDDYEGMVRYLNEMTGHYPEISAAYMANPDMEHTVIMNSGWEPADDWHVEEREWYVSTMSSEKGWSISAPYYDAQTGMYCITFSEKVFDSVSGQFLGVFGIDIYMDKLIDILGSTYSDSGYAFLADADGNIINHPYGSYQMAPDHKTNVSELPYSRAVPDSDSLPAFKDYDGQRKMVKALRNEELGFTIYVVYDMMRNYGKALLVVRLIMLGVFLTCTILVYKLLTALIKDQEESAQHLQAAADAAISAGKAKSRFLAQMSHEIRTPINAVLGMNEMIMRESGEENIREYAAIIQNAGRTLMSLINSILDFSKIEDGKMEILPIKYETATMINGLVNSISSRAKKKELEFITQIDENLPAALIGDDVRIGQVIMNLLTNAVKYTEKGSVTLKIAQAERSDKNVVLEVTVTDTGIGIRSEDMGKLFESFERLDENRNRNIEGTGLGMSIVTGLLAMMDSKLEVQSTYGKGSSFSFCLAQEIADPKPMGSYENRQTLAQSGSGSDKLLYAPKAAVLVVDDNSMNLQVAKSLMKLCGIAPDLATSGYEALDMLKEKHYGIIFLDHMMPGLDGIETMHRIRSEHLADTSTKIIALTANAVMGVDQEYIAAGFDDYLSKPIELPKLESMLAKHLPNDLIHYRSRKAGASQADAGHTEMNPVSDISSEDLLEDEYMDFMPEDTAAEGHDPSVSDLDTVRKDLEDLGVNISEGLLYCADDFGIYSEVLKEYAESAASYITNINSCLERKDWDNYRIAVHAIKSSSKTIGASELSEMARSLEMAAKESDSDYIIDNNKETIDLYKKITDGIINILSKTQNG